VTRCSSDRTALPEPHRARGTGASAPARDSRRIRCADSARRLRAIRVAQRGDCLQLHLTNRDGRCGHGVAGCSITTHIGRSFAYDDDPLRRASRRHTTVRVRSRQYDNVWPCRLLRRIGLSNCSTNCRTAAIGTSSSTVSPRGATSATGRV